MAKKKKSAKKKASRKKKAQEKEQEEAPPSEETWLYNNAPWEEYYGPYQNKAAEQEIVRVIERSDGSTETITQYPVDPNTTGIRAGLSEKDLFAHGDRSNTRRIYSESSVENVLLDEDVKIRAMEMAYKFDREDPVFHAIVQGYTNFIIGKGVLFRAKDENPDVQKYLEEFWRINKLDGTDSHMVKRWMKVGELCLRWFSENAQGNLADYPKVRLVPFWRITQIITEDEDDQEYITFKITKPRAVGEVQSASALEEVDVPAEQIQYWYNGEPDEVRGEPPFISVMRAIKWYSDWLLNRVVLNRFRTAHVLFKKIINTSPNKVSSIRNNTPTASASRSGKGGKIEKRLPNPGTMVVHSDNVEYEYKSPKLEATDAKEDARKILTYIAAGGIIPEFMLGDASNANLASTFVSQNPFVRQVEYYQDLFKGIFQDIFKRVIEHGIKVGKIPKTSTETVVKESSVFMRKINQTLKKMGLSEANKDGNNYITRTVPTKTEVDITFPSILHSDRLEEAKMYQIHQNMGLASIETLREKTDYDHETEERRMENGPESRPDRFANDRDQEIEDDEDGDDDE